MELKVLDAGDVSRVALVGRLDIQGVSAIEVTFLAVTATRRKPAIVDLSGTTFIGSLGIGMLVGSAKALARHGSKMVLLDPQEMVEKTLVAASVTDVIPVAHGLDEARAMLMPS